MGWSRAFVAPHAEPPGPTHPVLSHIQGIFLAPTPSRLTQGLEDALTLVGFVVGNGGMGHGDDYWGLYLYRDYYRDPFPHSLLRTRQISA